MKFYYITSSDLRERNDFIKELLYCNEYKVDRYDIISYDPNKKLWIFGQEFGMKYLEFKDYNDIKPFSTVLIFQEFDYKEVPEKEFLKLFLNKDYNMIIITSKTPLLQTYHQIYKNSYFDHHLEENIVEQYFSESGETIISKKQEIQFENETIICIKPRSIDCGGVYYIITILNDQRRDIKEYHLDKDHDNIMDCFEPDKPDGNLSCIKYQNKESSDKEDKLVQIQVPMVIKAVPPQQ